MVKSFTGKLEEKDVWMQVRNFRVEQYKAEVGIDPLEYWTTQGVEKYPKLGALAIRLLSAPTCTKAVIPMYESFLRMWEENGDQFSFMSRLMRSRLLFSMVARNSLTKG
ncbi:hypothetical protein HK098_003947 [Nowakowskiella sp. JEL0407]|nr:hypothetical protein HK098_003947 [Nowakowskiella sp. JEL0407]